jgi:hypothetical protein
VVPVMGEEERVGGELVKVSEGWLEMEGLVEAGDGRHFFLGDSRVNSVLSLRDLPLFGEVISFPLMTAPAPKVLDQRSWQKNDSFEFRFF